MCAITAFSAVSCNEKINVSVPEGYTRMDVAESNGVNRVGYGCQIDTHIYKAYNAMSNEELEEFYSRVKEINIQTIRTQVFPEWYERGNDNTDYDSFDYNSANVDFNSIEMQQLFKLLDFCEENKITVDLSFYGCNSIYESQDGKITGSWLGAPYTKNWITSPKLVDENGNSFAGLEEFAETVYGMLNYALNTKKYTCVTEFSVYPEPNLAYVTANGTVSYSEYVKLCKTVNEKLKKENIRNKIKFSGPAVALQNLMGLNSYINDLDSVFDKYTISSYSFDDKDDDELLSDYGAGLQNLVAYTGKTFSIAEFGSKNVIDAANQTDIETYDRALFLARYMICLANQGCASMKYWEICDMYYGGFMMNLGLWKFRNKEWKARPQYYTWSLITKYTDIGSEVYPLTKELTKSDETVAVAFKLPNGKWTYMVCNTGDTAEKLSFVNLHGKHPEKMNLYEVRASKCDGECKPMEVSNVIKIQDGAINVKVLPNSFVVLSEK